MKRRERQLVVIFWGLMFIFFGIAHQLQAGLLKINALYRERPARIEVTRYPITIPAADSISLDGRLDEGQWQKALLIDNFIKHQEAKEPLTGILLTGQPSGEGTEVLFADQRWKKATYNTRCYLLHDDKYLYIGAEAEIPAGKRENLKYGVWPGGEGFDNTEFIGLFIDRGKPYTYAKRRYMTCWRAEYYIFIDWKGKVIDAKIPGQWKPPNEDFSSGIEVKINRMADKWILEGRIPLTNLSAGENPKDINWLINVGRVTGYPEGGIPIEASSWTGTFLGRSLLRRCRLGSFSSDVEVSALSVGKYPAGGNIRIPHGEQVARILLYSPVDSTIVKIEHKISFSGKTFVVWNDTVKLKRGLNLFKWKYNAPSTDYRNTITLSREGKIISIHEVDSQTTPSLLLYPKEWQVAPPESISACVEIGATRTGLKGKELEVKLSSGNHIIASRIFTDIKKPIVDLTIPLNIQFPKPGKYRLSVTLLSNGKQIASKSHNIEILPPLARIGHSGKIELVDASLTPFKGKYPVTTGIPFPKGLLCDINQLKLVDNSNREVPCEFLPLGRWSRDGSIRWVRLNFLYDSSKKYFVEYNSGEQKVKFKSHVEVIENKNRIRVKTGSLDFTIGKDGFKGFQSFSVNKKALKVGKGEIYAIDEAGIRYSSLYGEGKTEIEYSGPFKTVLKMSGSCCAKSGTELLRYVIRITTYAEETFLRVDSTFILACDTRLYRFRKIGMDLGISFPNSQFEAKIEGEMKNFGKISGVSAVQKFWDIYEIKSEEKVLQSGKNLDGIFRFSTYSHSCAIGIRRFRELCPVGIKQKRGGEIEMLFWPEGVEKRWDEKQMDLRRILCLPFAHQGPLLDFNIPHEYQKIANKENRAAAHYMSSGIWNGNAMGCSRTHSFVLCFDKPGSQVSLRKAETFLVYPYVSANAEWMCKSEAIGFMPILPQKKQSKNPYIAEVEELLERNFDIQIEKLREVSFGKWNWGRLNQSFLKRPQRWTLWRIFMNTHQECGQAPWMLFIRSTNPKYLEFARAHTNHSVDIGWCHYADVGMRVKGFYGKVPGGVCDYKGYVPWNSGARNGYNWYVDFILFHYYLTGNLRAKDTAEEIYRLLLSFYNRNRTGRSGATNIETGIRLYYFTHDGRILPFIKNNFEVKLREQTKVGFVPGGTEFSDWLSGYYQLTGDKRAIMFGERIAKADVANPWWYNAKRGQESWEISAFAYNYTKNPQYLRPALYRLESGTKWYEICWAFLQSYVGYFLYALEQAGPDLKPLASNYALQKVGLAKDNWKTVAMYMVKKKQKQLTIKLCGSIPKNVKGEIRVVDKEGNVLATQSLPHLEWKLLPLGNPPVNPESTEITIDVTGKTGPFKLQVKGEGTVKLLLPSTPLFTEGKFGKGILLQNLGNVRYRRVNFNLEEGTIEMWFKPLWKSPEERSNNVSPFYNVLFNNCEKGSGNYGFEICFWDSGRKGDRKFIIARWKNYFKGDSMSSQIVWPEEKWHHIAFCWKKGEKGVICKLFLDGKLVVSKQTDGEKFPVKLNNKITLGTNGIVSKNAALNGIIDSLRISSRMKEKFDLSQPPSVEKDTLFLVNFENTFKPELKK